MSILKIPAGSGEFIKVIDSAYRTSGIEGVVGLPPHNANLGLIWASMVHASDAINYYINNGCDTTYGDYIAFKTAVNLDDIELLYNLLIHTPNTPHINKRILEIAFSNTYSKLTEFVICRLETPKLIDKKMLDLAIYSKDIDSIRHIITNLDLDADIEVYLLEKACISNAIWLLKLLVAHNIDITPAIVLVDSGVVRKAKTRRYINNVAKNANLPYFIQNKL